MTTRRWTDAFTRTNAGPGVWHNRHALMIPGHPVGSRGMIFSNLKSWQAFADGGIESDSGYGFSQPIERVHGFAAMRFLCVIHGIEPPKRQLKHEPFLPDTVVLVRAVLAQMVRAPTDTLHLAVADDFWDVLKRLDHADIAIITPVPTVHGWSECVIAVD